MYHPEHLHLGSCFVLTVLGLALHFLPVHVPQLVGDTQFFSPPPDVAPPRLASVAIVRRDFHHLFLASPDVMPLRVSKGSTASVSRLFYFYKSTQMSLSGSCFSGRLYLSVFLGCCHSFSSHFEYSVMNGFLNLWLTALGRTSQR